MQGFPSLAPQRRTHSTYSTYIYSGVRMRRHRPLGDEPKRDGVGGDGSVPAVSPRGGRTRRARGHWIEQNTRGKIMVCANQTKSACGREEGGDRESENKSEISCVELSPEARGQVYAPEVTTVHSTARDKAKYRRGRNGGESNNTKNMLRTIVLIVIPKKGSMK